MQEQSGNYFDETYELVKKYTDDRLLLLKIQTAKKTAKITSKVIFIVVSVMLLFFVLLFCGLMLAYFFAEKMHSNFYGFLTVAGLFFGCFLLFVILYKSIISKKIKNMVTEIFFENDSYNSTNEDEE